MLSIIFGTLAAKAKVKRKRIHSGDDGIVTRTIGEEIPTYILPKQIGFHFAKSNWDIIEIEKKVKN